MSELHEKLKRSIGRLSYAALMKALAGVQIKIDAEARHVWIYRNGHDPARVTFRDLEKLVNDAH